MHSENETDRKIEELFRTARRVDEKSAVEFGEVSKPPRQEPWAAPFPVRGARRFAAIGLSTAAAASGLALIVYAALVGRPSLFPALPPVAGIALLAPTAPPPPHPSAPTSRVSPGPDGSVPLTGAPLPAMSSAGGQFDASGRDGHSTSSGGTGATTPTLAEQGGVVGGPSDGGPVCAPIGDPGGVAGGVLRGVVGGVMGGVPGGVPGGVLGGVVGGVPSGAQPHPVERVVVMGQKLVALDEAAETKVFFTDQFVENLPVLGRSRQNVLTLSPGVNDANGDGKPNVHGARERNFKANVDGVSSVDPLTGTFMSNINPSALEAVEVVTTGAAAGYGRAVGDFGRIVTKRGGVSGGVLGGVLGGVPSRLQVESAASPAPPGPAGLQVNSDTEADANTESYALVQENDLLSVSHNPLSTFSIDVDTASYSNLRRFLQQGLLPPKGAVRIEELINYFPYDYPPPKVGEPFSVNVEIADCPWSPKHRLARIGLKAEEVSRRDRGGSNLVFLIDVSGSMDDPAKLPLVKAALALMVQELDGADRIAIVVYAGASGLVLPSTSGNDKPRIMAALDELGAGGSTNGGEGLRLAYKVAKENFIPGGINRVILATDGDFNVGVTDRGELLATLKKDADDGIFLTALGFGMGNLKDDMLETLADKGNGNYAYIDSLMEARKVLVEQLGGTLVTVAKDVKIQVEFNPARVEAYRLIGYENRLMPKEHFNDDTKDAGEIGSGHTVTALYELAPPEAGEPLPSVEPLKYQTPAAPSREAASEEAFTVKIRYKSPESKESRLLAYPVIDAGHSLAGASKDFKFAGAVALFGMILRESAHVKGASLDIVSKLADEGMGRDDGGYRAEFRRLAGRAASLHDTQRARGAGDKPEP